MLRLSLLALVLLAVPAAAQPFSFDEAFRGGGTSSDTGEGIALAADGSRAVAGTFEGTATFGDLSVTSAGDSDFFLVKYDASGEAAWARRGGTDVFNDFGTATAIAPDGSVYATGFFTGVASFDGGQNPDASLTTFSDFDAFLVKYDAEGDLEWARQAGGVEQDTGRELALDADGNVYLTGGFGGTGTFGGVTLTSAGSTDAFLAKYDPDGEVVWARRGGSDQGDLAYGVAVTADGAAYVSGSFRGVAQFGGLPIQSAGSSDVFVVQYDPDGEPVWVEGIGADGSEFTRGGGIALGSEGEVYVQGSFSNTILVGSDVLVSTGFTDIFVAKLDPDGNELWGRRGGGDGTNFSAALAVDAGGNALAVGYADGTGTFDDTPITTQGRDGYFAVFDAEGELVTVDLLGGTSQDAATGVAVSDALGRFAVAGLFRSTATFGDTTLTSAGSNDVFVLDGPTGAPPLPSVLFVDADATGAETGLSWADAFTDLQDALALALADTLDVDSLAIWVAEGTYLPTDDGDRTVSFELQSGLALYGGFDGTETSLDQRDPAANETILSGDIGKLNESSDNSYHVVIANEVRGGARLDGFTVTGGEANASGTRSEGAGLRISQSEAVLANMSFVANRAIGDGLSFNFTAKGGGIYAESTTLDLDNVRFEQNRVLYPADGGGGLYVESGDLSATGFLFSLNSAGGPGGGLYASSTSLQLSNGRFESNSASSPEGEPRGGGLYTETTSSTLAEVDFVSNAAGSGGGMSATTAILTDCSFIENSANGFMAAAGGGLSGRDVLLRRVLFEANVASPSGLQIVASGGGASIAGQSTLLDVLFRRNRTQASDKPSSTSRGGGLQLVDGETDLFNAIFEGNESAGRDESNRYGGGVYVGSAQATFSNSLFVGNVTDFGGGLHNAQGAVRILNSTFSGNAARVGAALYSTTNVAPEMLRNVIMWGDDGPELQTVANVSYSIIEEGFGGVAVLDADPLFVRDPNPGPDGEWGTEDDDYGDLRLQEGSPAVDFGLAEFLPPDTFDLDQDGDTEELLPVDLDGEARVQGNAPDLGAYESPFAVALEPGAGTPMENALGAAYPNPFSRRTTLALDVAEAQAVTVEVFDVLGRRVATVHDGLLAVGQHRIVIEAAALPAGVYVVRAEGETFHFAQRVTAVR